MIYCFDLDGTICSSVENSNYEMATPDAVVVAEINRLYDLGNTIKIMTARGSVSKVDHTELTKSQLESWGVKYTELIMNKKPYADVYIDDRGVSIDDWKKSIPLVRGVLAGSFDLIHPGYVRMFKEAKLHCTHLTVALQSVPKHKLALVHTLDERKEVLESIKYIDEIVVYETEEDLVVALDSGKFDVRFLGTDYLEKDFTGSELNLNIVWIDRAHGYSTSDLKQKIRGYTTNSSGDISVSKIPNILYAVNAEFYNERRERIIKRHSNTKKGVRKFFVSELPDANTPYSVTGGPDVSITDYLFDF